MGSYVNDFNENTRQYFNEIKGFESLSKEEEKQLSKRIKNLDHQAKNKLITANLKYVVDVAKRYKGKGVSMDDLIAEGNMGLLKAFDTFDYEKDVKFISYARWWIEQEIQVAVKKTPQTNDEYPEDEIISDYNEDAEDIAPKIKSDKDIFLIEEKKDEKDERKRITEELLDDLDDREYEIIRASFGLDGNEPQNLDEIGRLYGLTSERVRVIKNKALTKLRSYALEKDVCVAYK
jgi:RNA polymerase primary sigma factor